MQEELGLLGVVLEKYLQISKMPHDFGVGEVLYPSEIHLISTIALQENISVTELARQHGNTKGAISQILGKLESKGFVTRTPDPDKRSRILVSVTEKGLAAHQGHCAFHSQHDATFISYLASLNQADFNCFSKFCKEMNRWMDLYLNPATSETISDRQGLQEVLEKIKEQENAEQTDK